MHREPGLRVRVDETVQALLAIMAGRLGLTLVVDDAGALGGILTDGDLKRILLARGTDDLFATPVGACRSGAAHHRRRGAGRRRRARHGGERAGADHRPRRRRPGGPARGVLHLDCLRLGVR